MIASPASHRFAIHGSITILSLWFTVPPLVGATVLPLADLVKQFPEATIRDCNECTTRRPASAGNEKKDALFAPPQAGLKPASIRYPLTLPAIGPNEKLLLAFDIGLSDGITDRTGIDGVRFEIRVGDTSLFRAVTKDSRWQSYAVDLTPFAGRTIELDLRTYAIANNSFDQALWGAPHVWRFTGSVHHPNSVGSDRAFYYPIRSGILAVRAPTNSVSMLKPLGPGTARRAVTGRISTQPDGTTWILQRFQFDEAAGTALSLPPKTREVWLAPLTAHPVILRVTPKRSPVQAGKSVPLLVEVSNKGQGILEATKATVTLAVNGQPIGQPKVSPEMAPGTSWNPVFPWTAPDKAGTYTLRATLTWGEQTQIREEKIDVATPQPQDIKLMKDRWKNEFHQARKTAAGTGHDPRSTIATGFLRLPVQ